MKLAIFQEQLYHTEIFGFIFDFLVKNRIFEIDIYYKDFYDNNSYINFYLSIFKDIKPTFFKPNEITENQNNYDKIIFTTNPKNNYNIKYSNKTIVIIHKIDQFIKNSINIGLSKLIFKNYVQPIFTYNFKFKNNLTKNILIMGNLSYKNIKDLLNNIDNFKNYTFYCVSRCCNLLKDKNKKKLILLENISTDIIIDLFINQIDYVLLLNKIPSVYHNNIISGCVFQSLSFGIPIICDKQYFNIYKYPSSITYNKSINEIINKLNLIDINQYNIMQNNILEFNKIIINNNNKYLYSIINENIEKNHIKKNLVKIKIKKI